MDFSPLAKRIATATTCRATVICEKCLWHSRVNIRIEELFDGRRLPRFRGQSSLTVDFACGVAHLLTQLLTLFRAQVPKLLAPGPVLELPAGTSRTCAIAIPPATWLQRLRRLRADIGRHDVGSPTLLALQLLASHIVAEFAQSFATLHHHFLIAWPTTAAALPPSAGRAQRQNGGHDEYCLAAQLLVHPTYTCPIKIASNGTPTSLQEKPVCVD